MTVNSQKVHNPDNFSLKAWKEVETVSLPLHLSLFQLFGESLKDCFYLLSLFTLLKYILHTSLQTLCLSLNALMRPNGGCFYIFVLSCFNQSCIDFYSYPAKTINDIDSML